METTDILSALDRAIDAEEKARQYYAAAAEQTDDPAGVSMFEELAQFESHHRERLLALKQSLQASDSWIRYEGKSFSKTPSAEAAARAAPGDHADALEALRIAIAAEEKAEKEYHALARAAGDQTGREMFERLAEEEAMHRKLLDDQYYALSNRGVWLWGD